MLGKLFEEKHLFWKKVLLQNFFRNATKKLSARFVKKLPTFSEEIFQGKIISYGKIMSFSGLCKSFFRIIGRNVFSRCSRHSFLLYRWAWFLKKLLLENVDFSHVRIWSKSCSQVLRQLFASLKKIAIQVFTETFWRNSVLFLTETIFFSFTDFDRCIFEHSKKAILSVLSIRHSTYLEEWLDEISFLQRIRIVLPIPDFDWKISWIPAGKLRHSCRNCSCVSKLLFPVKFFLENVQVLFFFIVSWLIQLHFSLNFLKQSFQNCTLRARGHFRGKNLGVRICFSILQLFQDLSDKFSDLGRQPFGSNVRIALFPPAEQIDGKRFWKNVQSLNIFRTLGLISPDLQLHFSKVSSNLNFCVRRNILD